MLGAIVGKELGLAESDGLALGAELGSLDGLELGVELGLSLGTMLGD